MCPGRPLGGPVSDFTLHAGRLEERKTGQQALPKPPLPPSAALASGVFDFSHPVEPDLPGVPPPALASTLDYYLSIYGDPSAISPYSYSPTGGWQPVSTYSFVGGDLVITTSQVGIFAGSRDTACIPEPASMLLLGSGLLALLRRRRRT